MSWKPKYTITDKLLFTMREIGKAIGEIKSFGMTQKTSALLELEARELSSYASTSNWRQSAAVNRCKKTAQYPKKNHLRDTEREVFNYNKALQTLYTAVRSGKFTLNLTTLKKNQKQVLEGLMDNP